MTVNSRETTEHDVRKTQK